ncbi:MAG: hypothetical protein QNJ58_26485 [Desulfobacterales bacterium]|nr:hypothetical protein [Desulfobacterales bacterium]
MAKQIQFPKVFVGATYGRTFKSFREAIDDIPFQFAVAKDFLENVHLLEICKDLIGWADFCLFDVSTWNPNVTLELGLAHGMNKDYYILCNSRSSRTVPSDIKGIQRLSYSSYKTVSRRQVLAGSLWYQLCIQVGRKGKLLGSLWERFEDTPTGNRQRLYASRVLSSLRGGNALSVADLPGLRKGIGLNKDACNNTLKVLRQRNLINQSNRAIRMKRKLFPPSFKRKG